LQREQQQQTTSNSTISSSHQAAANKVWELQHQQRPHPSIQAAALLLFATAAVIHIINTSRGAIVRIHQYKPQHHRRLPPSLSFASSIRAASPSSASIDTNHSAILVCHHCQYKPQCHHYLPPPQLVDTPVNTSHGVVLGDADDM
jgi:hypothetical protein